MSKGLQLSLSIIIFLSGIGIGYFLTPEYRVQNSLMKKTHDLGQADQWVDLRYTDNMIAHHLSAIYLLDQALAQTDRQEIKDLANAVIAADREGIKQLYANKQAWYGNSRQIVEFNKVNLGDRDEKFDLRLLNALLIHHREAIDSAKEISTKSVRSEVLNLADGVNQSLSENSKQLEAWRKEWYGI